MKTRRDFLKEIGISGGILFLAENKLFSSLHNNKKVIMSELKPTGAETGNLYPFIEALAKKSDFSLSFLTREYKNIEEFKKITREKIAEVYRLNNAAEKFESKFFDVPHMFSKEMQEISLKWMKKWL